MSSAITANSSLFRLSVHILQFGNGTQSSRGFAVMVEDYIPVSKQPELLLELRALSRQGVRAAQRRLLTVMAQILKQEQKSRAQSLDMLRKSGVQGIWGDACYLPPAHFHNLQTQRKFSVKQFEENSEGETFSVKRSCETLPPCNTGTCGHGWPKRNQKRKLGGVKQC
jgi:hypothetical protein